MKLGKIKDDSIFSDHSSEEFWIILLILTLLGVFTIGMVSIKHNTDGMKIGKKEAFDDAIKAGVAYEENGIIKWY